MSFSVLGAVITTTMECGSQRRPAQGISTSAGESTDESSRATGKSGKMNGADPPAVMLENALKRRRAVDVADQPDRGRIEIGRHVTCALPRRR